jgi:PPM family protein phosphatase
MTGDGSKRITPPPPVGYRDSPPPTVHVNVEFGVRSLPAPHRSITDNHYLIVRLGRHQETLRSSLPVDDTDRFEEFGYGMVLADGIGHAGEVASRLAVSTLADLTIQFGRWHMRLDDPTAHEVMDRASRFYRTIDTTLWEAGRYRPFGLQSTLTAVYTAGDEMFFAHVGHSRAYLYRDGTLLPLTHHRSSPRERLGKPPDSHAVLVDDELRHALQEKLRGHSAAPSIDIERLGLLDGDTILLCTTGLTDVADDAALTKVLRVPGHSADEQCVLLADLAANAAVDDVTVLIGRYRIGARITV